MQPPTEFPTPDEARKKRVLKMQERFNKLFDQDRALIINEIIQIDTETVVINHYSLTYEFNILQQELEQKGYGVSRGLCSCHGLSGILGPQCSRNRMINISLNPTPK